MRTITGHQNGSIIELTICDSGSRSDAGARACSGGGEAAFSPTQGAGTELDDPGNWGVSSECDGKSTMGTSLQQGRLLTRVCLSREKQDTYQMIDLGASGV